MGCKNSKAKGPTTQPPTTKQDNTPTPNISTVPAAAPTEQRAKQPNETKKNEATTFVGRAGNGEVTDTGSPAGPRKVVAGQGGSDNKRAASNATSKQEVDDEGNPLILPNGNWVRTDGTPFYYSEQENLYFHPPSCQFYDPTNEMWYDPEKDEWYYDEENEAQS
ncbi:hypothetical protein TraAM80_00613 [Trypanosoma rangeli]|uniref:OCRE domain-containing protein n=1 Tax=Trypanosoma rangeli TaxID=5698 RepID=A0A3R7MVG2_TRYRA|nr:uncharacterized protein TraAM80_00613 [Trypanosoma rangeli]RNF11918.1 hypothetical protein TraAM80_00613 [Trypanosoma rangeli]|eukprot:RNF11918.1 hypothetical protein TraAM80_00613 [Trypanosoma rangeli]